jgi:hypothetical protein
MKWYRSGIRNRMPRQPPRNDTAMTWTIVGCATPVPGCAASMYRAGIVNTAPDTTCDELAPIDWMITFSRMVLLRENSGDRPIARIAIGIAASIPCPTLSAR